MSVDCAGPPLGVTDAGFRLHPGASDGEGDTEQVSVVAPLKPLTGSTVIVEVDDPPAVTEEGLAGVELKVKSGGCTAVPVPESWTS